MAFMDGTAWKDRFLAKSRKKIKQAGRLLMALAVGGCTWGQSDIVFAGTQYQFSTPSSNNTVTFDESGYTSSTIPVTGNTLLPTDKDAVYGGYSQNDEVSQNKLVVNSGEYSQIVGGYSYNNNSKDNTVIFNNGSAENLDGGRSRSGDNIPENLVSNNHVTVNGGTLDIVNGGYMSFVVSTYGTANTIHGTVSNNSVTVNDGNITGNSANLAIAGGLGYYSNVINNSVTINGGIITGQIVGGDAVTPGYVAHGNTINIYNAPDLTNAFLYGGRERDNSYQRIYSHTGNTLNIHTSGLTAQNIAGFEKINFYLPSTITNGDTVLTLTNGTTDLSGTSINAGVEGDANLSTGDVVTLIKNTNGITTDNTTTYGKLTEGVSLDYEITVEKTDNTSIVAKIEGISSQEAGKSTSSSSPLKAQTSILPTPMLSSSVLALQGTNRLLEWLPPDDFGMEEESSSTEEKESEEVGKATSSGDFSIFANAGFTNLRTKTGSNSYIDSHSGGFDIGAARTLENSRGKLVFAPIIDYGTGSYDSYVNGMHGSGKTKYWAGGIIARQMNHNGFYYEASIRAGRTSVDFASNDFMQGTTPIHESYDVSAPVYAGHIRLGRLYQIDRSSQLHIYGIYAHNHQNGMTAQLATGETYRFGSVDSGRLRIGARLSWMKKKTQKFYSGIAYQYEFSNSASGSYRGYSTESSNLRGSSGMIELGWQVKPTENSPWMVDVGAVGWIGHQKGFSIQAKIKKAF